MMRLSPVFRHMLVFISVLSLTRVQTTATAAIFYPFGSAAGDTNNPAVDDGSSSVIQLLSPFLFFGRTYQQIYVNNNGYLTFNQPSSAYTPYRFLARGSQDIIAGLWTDLDNRQRGVVSYHQYTSGNVLTRATQDINTHFPSLTFSASWVFVATWDKVAYYSLTTTETSFQVVLISGGYFSFILMNYGDIAVTSHPVEAGYDTVNSTHYFVIPGSNSGSSILNLKSSSNVSVSGLWAFKVDGGQPQVNPTSSTTTVSTATVTVTAESWTAPQIFYPFGSAAGDKSNPVNDDESSSVIQLLSPFLFFGRTYQQIYVNNNGYLTFSQPSSQHFPYSFPANGSQDIIAGLWTNLNNYVSGVVSYQQYANGSVLTRATQDINTLFPNVTFNASWVFVATWDKVAHFSLSSTETSFQVVLISDSNFSFILMNYGDIAVTSHPVQAGYDTVNSTGYFVIPGSNNGSSISNLSNTSNVNVTGRWAFRVDSGQHSISEETTTLATTSVGITTTPATTTTLAAQALFYPFGSAVGDTRNAATDDGSSSLIQLSSPFLFFGRTNQQIYVNNNGHLTLNQPSSQNVPDIPSYGRQDIIAGLWTNLDNSVKGVVSYNQYTSGNVLTRATQDINTHFPNLNFTASWVFVATWDKLAYFNLTSTETSFQVVLISGSNYSFILMNYGDIAVTGHPVQAGYDTINSTHYFVIPGFISDLRNSSNVNVPGRWAFRVDGEPRNSILKYKIVGFRVRLSSFSDLTQSGNTEMVLQRIKQELVKYGLPNSIELKLRQLQKIKPGKDLNFDFIIMRLSLVSQHLLVFISLLSLTRAQTTTPTTPTSATTSDPCHSYTVLDEPWRSPDNRYSSQLMCDADRSSWAGWYRLFIYGQSAQMPETCVDWKSCGTYIPMWLNGRHPTVEDRVVTRSVCGSHMYGCCLFPSKAIRVKACPGGYYVYEFVKPVSCLSYCAGQGILYSFGSTVGDTNNPAADDGNSSAIQLLSPFLFFGRTYEQIYVNNNGHLTFNQPSSAYTPYSFPANRSQDIIAGLWTNLDNSVKGVVSYNQYTSGNVLTRATQDINTHFPNLTFTASWVFVATWNKVAYYSFTNTETSFQVVLISGSNYSFILMNYGDIAVTGHPVEAGYDTINSTHYFVIPESVNGSFISNLRNSSNVNVPGRWAFRVDSRPRILKYSVVGFWIRLSSYSDLTQSGTFEMVLQRIKQELVKYGLPNSTELQLRKLQKIKP
ncbi:uncharacterized protein LOC127174522 [Labeo rohita]|uniref:uncharacterized protein LOC127174522 n=1 Tax=Labeo rohita TaxID=84645 RepID=UPI0021E272D0|nr:uncharacterized protein LOC127174522 [Labeo rohita]